MAKYPDDGGKVSRQNHIKRILSHSSEVSAFSITEITDKLREQGFEITRKTVERDIEDISRGYPLSETDSNPRRFYFDGEFKIDFELTFNEDQLQTIILALQSLKQMSPTVIKSLCNEVETTLASKLPKALSKELDHLKGLSNAAPTVLGEGSEIGAGIFQTVLLGLRKGKIFECQYYHDESKSAPQRIRTFAPLKLHFAGVPYLYVYDCEDNEVKLLRISRIHYAKLTEQDVNQSRSSEIKLDHVFGGYGKGNEKVIHYSVKCSSPMATRFNENKIHSTQTIELLNDGDYRIRFSVHDSSEVTRLLAQYGEHIKDIEPQAEYEKVKAIWKKGLGAA